MLEIMFTIFKVKKYLKNSTKIYQFFSYFGKSTLPLNIRVKSEIFVLRNIVHNLLIVRIKIAILSIYDL